MPAQVAVGDVGVEGIARKDIAHLCGDASGAAGIHGAFQQVEARDGGKGAGELELSGIVRVGTGAHADDYILELQLGREGSCRAYADDGIDVIEVKKLIRVDAHRRHAHAAAHDRHAGASIRSCEAEHVANGVKARDVFQIVVGDVARPQWVAGHEHGFSDVLDLGGVVGRRGVCHGGRGLLTLYMCVPCDFCTPVAPS